MQFLLRRLPPFEHVTTFNFDYDLDEPQQLGESYLDQVLILRRI